ncbi:BspA family leucine-rich repeat surface protein [Marinoscillum pacificum]|uniref:BspA family leucine-rich repeat surface protein n=1 Tax=Marinoscillum pacificum TaxID=392723 RepID=UPI0021572E21|nr:BspA family leucine-rich repeat surface protein [Marinoscillum pacificum]
MKKLLPLILSCVLTGSLYAQRAFITTWQTTTENESITIPTRGSGYAYTVDWGDGTDATTHVGSATHTYTDSDTYTVSIIGTFPRIYFNNGGSKDKILTIEQWGDIQWTNMNRAFKGCSNLTIPATDAPDLSNVTDMYDMFFGASSMNSDIGHWDVSNVENMRGVFLLASSFNQDISSWDVSNVTFMEFMFDKASSFNQDISSWVVSKVTSMKGIFQLSSAFDQNLGAWNIEKVENMSLMFNESGMSTANYNATLNGWADDNGGTESINTDVEVGVSGLHYSCEAVEARNILVNTYGWTFNGDQKQCPAIIQFQLDEGITEPVIDEINQTVYCEVDFSTSLNGLAPDLEVSAGASLSPASGMALDFTTPQVYTVTSEDETLVREWTVNIVYPSDSAAAITSFTLPGQIGETVIDTSAHTITIIMPKGLDLTSIAAEIATSPGASVSPASGVANDFSTPVTYTVTAYNGVTQQDWVVSVNQFTPFVTTWQTTSDDESITIPTYNEGYSYTVDWGDGTTDATTYEGNATHTYTDAGIHTISIIGDFPRFRFYDKADKDKILTVEQWGDIEWETMFLAFGGCSNLTTVPEGEAPDLTNVTDLRNMFYKATSFNSDLSAWDVSNVTNMSDMFQEASSFNGDLNSWDVGNVTVMSRMFRYASSFDQDLGAWDVGSVTDMSYIFDESGILTTNYDATLTGWADDNGDTQTIPTDLEVGVSGLNYSCDGNEARSILVNTYGWTFDGDSRLGEDPPVPDEDVLPAITLVCESLSALEAPTATGECGETIIGTHDAAFPITESTTVTWTYTDDAGNEDTQVQEIIWEYAPPELAAVADQTVDEGSLLTFTASSTPCAQSEGVTYVLDQVSLDKGMTLNDATGIFEWTPSAEHIGEHEVTITVVENGDTDFTDSQVFTVVVNDINWPPVISALTDQSVLGYSEFATTIEATDADGDALVFSIDDVSESKGMLIDESQVLRWTPTFIHQGSHAVEVVVMEETDHELTDTLRFTVDVEEMRVWDGNAWSIVNYNRVHVITGAYDTDAHGALEVERDLIVEASGSLHIGAGSPVAVFSADVYNYGEVLVAPGGELIPFGGTFYGDNYIVERNTTFDQSTGQYSMIGSPVKDASFDMLGENALVYFYDESEAYDPGGTEGLNRFKDPLANGMSVMEAGVGYFSAFTGDEDGLVTFVGTPYSSQITRELTSTDHAANEDAYEGYHILSNPFTVSLSIYEFLSENEDLEGAVYVWDDNGSDEGRGSNSDYIIHNGDVAVQTSPGGRSSELEGLSTGQGFFVKMKEGVRETEVVLSPEMYGDADNETFFRQSSQAIARLNLTGSDGFFRQTVIGWVDDISMSQADRNYDAPVFDPASANLLYTFKDGKELAIQGVNHTADRIPVGVHVSEADTYTFSLDTEESPGYYLYLHDLQTGAYQLLNDQPYTFTTSAGKFSGRFELGVASSILNTLDFTDMIYAHGKTLKIRRGRGGKGNGRGQRGYRLMSLDGRQVWSGEVADELSVTFDHLPVGVYIITDGSFSKKILLK